MERGLTEQSVRTFRTAPDLKLDYEIKQVDVTIQPESQKY